MCCTTVSFTFALSHSGPLAYTTSMLPRHVIIYYPHLTSSCIHPFIVFAAPPIVSHASFHSLDHHIPPRFHYTTPCHPVLSPSNTPCPPLLHTIIIFRFTVSAVLRSLSSSHPVPFVVPLSHVKPSHPHTPSVIPAHPWHNTLTPHHHSSPRVLPVCLLARHPTTMFSPSLVSNIPFRHIFSPSPAHYLAPSLAFVLVRPLTHLLIFSRSGYSIALSRPLTHSFPRLRSFTPVR